MSKELSVFTFKIGAPAAPGQFSIGCFCEDESRCHCSRLYKIIQDRAAEA